MNQLRDRSWINYEKFLKCFEEIKGGDYINIPSKKMIKKDDNLRLQKMLCNRYIVFYCVLRYETGDDLDREGLCKAFSMIEKKSKAHLEAWAERYIERHSKNHQARMTKIGFNDYYNLAILLEYSFELFFNAINNIRIII